MKNKKGQRPFLFIGGKNMNYMMDKINLLENKNTIIEGANEIVQLLIENKKLDDSEKLMTIELALAKLNYELYHISGDADDEMPK